MLSVGVGYCATAIERVSSRPLYPTPPRRWTLNPGRRPDLRSRTGQAPTRSSYSRSPAAYAVRRDSRGPGHLRVIRPLELELERRSIPSPPHSCASVDGRFDWDSKSEIPLQLIARGPYGLRDRLLVMPEPGFATPTAPARNRQEPFREAWSSLAPPQLPPQQPPKCLV